MSRRQWNPGVTASYPGKLLSNRAMIETIVEHFWCDTKSATWQASYSRYEIREPFALRRDLFSIFYLSCAVQDDADGGAVQPHEVNHLAEPVILNAKGTLNPLFGEESGTSWLNYLNSFLNSRPVVFPAARRPIRLPTLPFFTAETSFQIRRSL